MFKIVKFICSIILNNAYLYYAFSFSHSSSTSITYIQVNELRLISATTNIKNTINFPTGAISLSNEWFIYNDISPSAQSNSLIFK